MISEALERDYNARLAVPDHPIWFGAWKNESDRAREELACQLDLVYDRGEKGSLDFFPAQHATGPCPCLVFIHGGYWRAMDKSDFSFLATPWVGRGVHVIVMNYMLCPQATLSDIVSQVRSGYRWMCKQADSLGIDDKKILLIGHSAGAHLAAMVLADATHPAPAGMLGLSGIYDLVPLLQTSINQDLKLNETTAKELSPMHLARPQRSYQLRIYDGQQESAGFHGQTDSFARAWGAQGHGQLPGLHHFSILDPLKDPASALARQCAQILAVTSP